MHMQDLWPISSQTRLQPTLSLEHGPEAVEEYFHINQMVLSRVIKFNIHKL